MTRSKFPNYILGSKLGDVAAVVPNPHQNLAISQPIKYVTRNGIEVTLDELKDQMNKANDRNQSDDKNGRKSRKKYKRNRLSCHMCNAPDCSDSGVCHGAISCFTSIFRDSYGVVRKSKGNHEAIITQ